MKDIRHIAALALLATSTASAAPTLDPAEDGEHFGEPMKFLFWEPDQQVAGYRNMEKVFPTRQIEASDNAFHLGEDLRDLGEVEMEVEDDAMSVNRFFEQFSVAGLLVIKNGDVVYERYGLGNTRDSRWVSFSVAKSVTSMLVGAAIKDGYIESVDESVTDYLPRLKGSSYDQSTIRDILHMASGVRWNEDYADPESDLNQAEWPTLSLYEYLRHLPRDGEPGQKFNYNTAETNLVGTLLRSAIGNNLSTYLSEKIWHPFGMESDANWLLSEPGGGETGGCCISATLRDYGRIGLFAMNNGRLADGSSPLPDNWMSDSTSPSKGYNGYGYLWWLKDDGSYDASGIFGQGIYINPQQNVVIAIHSAREHASTPEDWAWQDAMYEALLKEVSD